MTEKKEYIEREALIQRLAVSPLLSQMQASCFLKEGVLDIIQKVPAADVVEVVRCKDCKYSYWEKQTAISEVLKCGTHNGLNDEVDFCDFCSYGERKERG